LNRSPGANTGSTASRTLAAQTAAPAITLESLVADLRRLVLAEGDAVVMRCATRAIAPGVKGMASLLLDALLETVGPGGTVVGPPHAALPKASDK
jgi:aminoglycoside N3'-acetyltransferase